MIARDFLTPAAHRRFVDEWYRITFALDFTTFAGCRFHTEPAGVSKAFNSKYKGLRRQISN